MIEVMINPKATAPTATVLINKWDFDNDTITKSVTLYAKWNNTLNITINFGITDIKITENTDSVTGVTTLTADTGYTDYTWKIDDEAPDGTNVSIDSENPNILTINSLSHGVYGITVFAKKNGITYSSFMQVKVQ